MYLLYIAHFYKVFPNLRRALRNSLYESENCDIPSVCLFLRVYFARDDQLSINVDYSRERRRSRAILRGCCCGLARAADGLVRIDSTRLHTYGEIR